MHALSHIEGVYPVSGDPALPRPFIGIVGAMHGNERCGLEVVGALRDPRHPIRAALRYGTLVLIHGNPEATTLARRHTPGGTDLNRLFDYTFVHTLPRHAWTPEHHRALALRPVIESLDALLDLHSATAPTEPFAIVSTPGLPLAVRLGCSYVTHGWECPSVLDKSALLYRLSERNRPAVAVECGQHDDPATVDTALAVTRRFLELLGVLPPVAIHRDHARPPVVEVAYRIAKPNDAFRFARPLEGFEVLRKGEKLGSGGGVELVASGDFVVLLPNDRVAAGEDLLFLGKIQQARFEHLPSSTWSEKDVA